ncbi:MAG: Tnp protein [Candidatus Levybacteria bacterium]|nr:Tnp protein [Candidatus Levybacteria bacterium]
MPYRKVVLAPEQIYHVFNRGVAALPIFLDIKSHARFINLINYYRFSNTQFSFSKLVSLPKEEKEKIILDLRKQNAIHVEILAYCLMPNHFHFLLKQITDKGISVFMTNLQNSYVKYFNIKNERAGPLFQSMFKAVRVETDEQLLHVSRYIHLNPSTAYIVEPKNLEDYKWSSLNSYLDKDSNRANYFVNPKIVLDFFKKGKDYKKFVLDQASYQRELDNIKHLALE